MTFKRKSEALEGVPLEAAASGSSPMKLPNRVVSRKKARLSKVSDVTDTDGEEKENTPPQSWKDIKLEGDDEGEVPIYDDCSEIRRKIRRLERTPGFVLTHWLKDIGHINNNSYGRFMRYQGRLDGAANGTYYAAYVYFEKVRIFEDKKKTATRLANERQLGKDGFARVNSTYWVTMRDDEEFCPWW
ncbi:hypothetical protein BDN70DRAFT_885888 [Pholiota conissans]|uniref:DUF7726 domain-containing protein n=1 Tax=Pholiota conissans TaxID=109636 RepID=A0A9P5YRH2_9AGAR|nr:hypothetical protein BDN70DRAFT_885888 [Pholiota conissans]